MELFEDLEFKPITEGLGFHRNASSPTSQSPVAQSPMPGRSTDKPFSSLLDRSTPPPSLKTQENKSNKPPFIPSLKPEYNFLDEESLNETKKFAQELTQPRANPDRTKIYEPIGRKDYSIPRLPKNSETAKAVSFSIPTPGAPASLSALRSQTIEKNKLTSEQKAATNMRPGFALSNKVATAGATIAPALNLNSTLNLSPTFNLSPTLNLRKTRDLTLVTCIPAAILDSVFSIGISLILLVGVLLVTKADLVGLLSNSKTDHFVQIQIGILFLMVLQMYILLARSTLFGQTIGEWTYDIQLGTDDQRRSALYPVQVVFRGLIFAITGFILLPILSELFGRDLAAPLTGLELQKTTQQGLNI